jgi:hypothetical protein
MREMPQVEEYINLLMEAILGFRAILEWVTERLDI